MASVYNLGIVYLWRNRIEDTERAFEESLALRRAILERDYIDMIYDLNGVVDVYRLQGRNTEAPKVLAEAITGLHFDRRSISSVPGNNEIYPLHDMFY